MLCGRLLDALGGGFAKHNGRQLVIVIFIWLSNCRHVHLHQHAVQTAVGCAGWQPSKADLSANYYWFPFFLTQLLFKCRHGHLHQHTARAAVRRTRRQSCQADRGQVARAAKGHAGSSKTAGSSEAAGARHVVGWRRAWNGRIAGKRRLGFLVRCWVRRCQSARPHCEGNMRGQPRVAFGLHSFALTVSRPNCRDRQPACCTDIDRHMLAVRTECASDTCGGVLSTLGLS